MAVIRHPQKNYPLTTKDYIKKSAINLNFKIGN